MTRDTRPTVLAEHIVPLGSETLWYPTDVRDALARAIRQERACCLRAVRKLRLSESELRAWSHALNPRRDTGEQYNQTVDDALDAIRALNRRPGK